MDTLENTLQEVTEWGRRHDIPLIGGRVSRTETGTLQLNWSFSISVPETVPTLLTKLAQTLWELRAEPFELPSLVHEVRNPLAVVSGHLERLQDELGLPPDHPRIVALQRNLDRIARRLDWAAHRDSKPQRTALSLVDIWRTVLHDLEPEWSGRQVEWILQGQTDDVETDPWIVEEILFNLAKNALEASPDHGVIRAALHADGGRQIFRVTNSIPPGVTADFIRSRLVRAGESAKGTGHGFGLAISQRLARKIGGDITLDIDGHDVSFGLSLPIRESAD